MNNLTPEYVEPEETGLNLFEDAASAAGSFPNAMLGYDKSSVDFYVRELESQISTLKQLVRHQRREMAFVQREVGTTNFTKLGAHATSLLRAAEAQADDLVNKAAVEAERIKNEARRVAGELRATAQSEADDVRLASLANLRKMREDHARAGATTLSDAKAQAAEVLAGAETEAKAIRDEASRQATAALEAAKIEAARLTQSAERDASAILLAARSQGEQTLAKGVAEANAAKDAVAELMAEARRHHAEANATLAEVVQHGHELRSAAQEEAEQVRLAAIREGEDLLASTRARANAAKDEIEEQVAWRKEQLEREIAALTSRKAAVVAQMSNIRDLASASGLDFPDGDPFAKVVDGSTRADAGGPVDAEPPAGQASTDTAVNPAVVDESEHPTTVMPTTVITSDDAEATVREARND